MHEELVKFFVATDELGVQHAALYQTAPFGLSAAPTGLERRCFSFFVWRNSSGNLLAAILRASSLLSNLPRTQAVRAGRRAALWGLGGPPFCKPFGKCFVSGYRTLEARFLVSFEASTAALQQPSQRHAKRSQNSRSVLLAARAARARHCTVCSWKKSVLLSTIITNKQMPRYQRTGHPQCKNSVRLFLFRP